MLLLKLYFAHYLSAELGDNIQKLFESMMDKYTGLEHEGLGTSFSSIIDAYENIFFGAYSCLNQLIFHALDDLFPDMVKSCEEYRGNINFHCESKGFTFSPCLIIGLFLLFFGKLN